MIIKVTQSIFRDAFQAIRPNQFSYEALGELYNYLDEYQQEPDLELDVIAICCDFSEYADLEEFQKNYGDEYETIGDIEEITSVIQVGEHGFIIQNF